MPAPKQKRCPVTTTLSIRIRELAEAVQAFEWELPIDACETLRQAAEALEAQENDK